MPETGASDTKESGGAESAHPVAPSAPPAVSEPEQSEPVDTEPVDTEPVETEPADAEPVVTQPADTEAPHAAAETPANPVLEEPTSPPASPEPETAQPEATTPASPETETAQPEATTPASPESESAQPEATQPETAAPETPEPEAAATETTDPDGAAPKEAPTAPVAPTVVGGKVTAVSSTEVELTLDDGRQAVIYRQNFDLAGTDPTTVLQVGDGAEGAVLAREDPKGRTVLSRAWALKNQAWEKVVAAADSGDILHCKIIGTSKRGVVVDVRGLKGFVPSSHLEIDPPKDLSTYVGEMADFKVLDADRGKDRLVMSRRSMLLKEQRKAAHDLLASVKKGETRTGTVQQLTQFGAFVDIGGVTGLVHLSELSWERVGKAEQVVKVGQEVTVKVLDVKIKKRRVALSMKALAPDPFAGIEVGAVVTAPVTRLVDFGAFVDLGGIEGLVHLSEMAEYRVSAPEEIVMPGQEVRVKILGVDKKRRRIELSIRQAVSDGY